MSKAQFLSYGDNGDVTTFIFDGERLIVLKDGDEGNGLVLDSVLGPQSMKELAEAMYEEATKLEEEEAQNDDKTGTPVNPGKGVRHEGNLGPSKGG